MEWGSLPPSQDPDLPESQPDPMPASQPECPFDGSGTPTRGEQELVPAGALPADVRPPLADASDVESLPSPCGSEIGPRRVRRRVEGTRHGKVCHIGAQTQVGCCFSNHAYCLRQ